MIIDNVPDRLKLLIVLASYVGLRQGELLELRRSDVDGVTGRISVARKIDKDVIPGAVGACPNCGRVISAPKTVSGVRTVHVPPPFVPMLQKHLLGHAAPGPTGLLFPGDRTDHMSVRFLMDRYRPARAAAGRPDLTITTTATPRSPWPASTARRTTPGTSRRRRSRDCQCLEADWCPSVAPIHIDPRRVMSELGSHGSSLGKLGSVNYS